MSDTDGLLTAEEKTLALGIARRTLEIALTEGRIPTEAELGVPSSGVFQEKRACFVTLHKARMLRGCIGHILPVEELWKSIRSNAISAAMNDHRFAQVSAAELPSLDLEISVLTLPVEIPDHKGFKAGRDGIILELSGSRAVFLPQVAPEQGWDEETTLTHLSLKAGLPADAWRNPKARFRTFRAQVFQEKA